MTEHHSTNGFKITRYQISNVSHRASGTTALIRDKLKFDDGIKWNKFCKLRTNLIKKNFESIDMTQINLNLNINKQKVDEIAECLRLEFEYSVTTRPEFQKLVILAIQSIRRNLIRAQNNKQIKLKKIKVNNPIIQDMYILDDDTRLITLIFKDIVDDVIPLKKQANSITATSELPDLNMFMSGNPLTTTINQTITKDNNIVSKLSLPFFLKEKILTNVQKSRTFYQLSRYGKDQNNHSITLNSNIFIEYKNLIALGENSIKLSSNYIFERFYSNANSNIIDFILEQITKSSFISNLSLQLFQSSTTIKLSHNNSNNNNNTIISMLYLTIGALVKDFGFDPILYDISEILNHLIMVKYPNLTKKESSSSTSPNKSTPNVRDKDILVSTLSMNPQIANKEVYKHVEIKYHSKKQDFNFPLLSNATPTITEIISNCKQLFQIKQIDDNDLNIYYNDILIKDDIKLSNLFNDLKIKNLSLELK